jgi:uncharacterized pyridoxal phosphate-containing UPF0001 family protein
MTKGKQISEKYFPKDLPGFSNKMQAIEAAKLAKEIDEELKKTWENAQNSFIENEYEQSKGGPWHHSIKILNTLKTPYKNV